LQLGADSARPYLELALSDSSVNLRHFAMEQLAPKMTESDMPILQQLIHDHDKPSWENESLHDLALKTLRRIGSDESLALINSVAIAEKTGS
jgi:hypothetical protein